MRLALIIAARLALIMAALALVGPAQAAGSTCGDGARPWVRVSPGGADFVPRLRAELGARGVDVCAEGGPQGAAAIASVDVDYRPNGVGISVSVRDEVTSKKVSRDFPLEGIPSDGRPLAIALAVSELLRASWAELGMTDAPQPAQPVPEAVRSTVEKDVSRAPTPGASQKRDHASIALAVAVEHFSGGQTLIGGDARVSLALGAQLAATARLGLRASPDTAAANGSVRATALVAGLGATYTITRQGSVPVLDAIARCDAWAVRFDASAGTETTALPGSAAALTCGGGLAVWWRPSTALEIGGEAVGMGVIRPVSASDNGVEVVSLSGFGAAGALSLRGVF